MMVVYNCDVGCGGTPAAPKEMEMANPCPISTLHAVSLAAAAIKPLDQASTFRG